MFFVQLIAAPMAAYLMTLLWAVLFGNTAGESDLMIEEWIICIQIYVFVVVALKFKRSKPQKEM